MHALHLKQALLCLLDALSIASFVHSFSRPIDVSYVPGPGQVHIINQPFGIALVQHTNPNAAFTTA